MSQPPRQQAYWRGDHPEPEAPFGCLNGAIFLVVGLLIGVIIAWLWLHQLGYF